MNKKINFNDKLKSTSIIIGLSFVLVSLFVTIFAEELLGISEDISMDLMNIVFILLMAICLINTNGITTKLCELFDFKILKEIIYLFLLTTFIEALFGSFFIERIFCFHEVVYNISLYEPLGLCIISTVIFAPISEELFFRGILFNRLNLILSNKKYGLIISILLTTFVFAFAHGISTGLIIFLTSIPFCILYLKHENIFVSVLLHSISNLSVMVSLILYSFNICDVDAIISNSLILSVIFNILGIISLILMIKYLVSNYKLIIKNIQNE